MRAAIYIRRSRDEQSEYSPEAQERQCRLYCELHGFEAVKTAYVDDDYSGTRSDRPDFERMLDDARAGKIQAVVVHKLDRLARNAELALRTINELERLNVTFISVSENIDFSTPMGRMVLTTLAGVAEYYSRNLATETRKGLQEKAMQGHWVGPLPLGYVKDADAMLVPSNDSPAVQLAFRLYGSSQHSYTSVADELNNRGWRTLDWRTGERRLFGRESVRTILKNRAYIGYVQCSGQEYLGVHPPLIDQETWDAVQAVMDERHGNTLNRKPDASPDAWLVGRLYCEHCGRKIWHQRSGRYGGFRYYRCSGISNRVCEAPMVKAEQLENQMLADLMLLSVPPTLRDDVLHETRRMMNEPIALPPDVDMKQIEARLRRLGRAYTDGLMSDEEYERERDALERMRQDVAPFKPAGYYDQHAAMQILTDLPGMLLNATGPERKAVVYALFSHVHVKDTALVAVTPRADVEPLIRSIVRCVGGVADGARTPSRHISLDVLGCARSRVNRVRRKRPALSSHRAENRPNWPVHFVTFNRGCAYGSLSHNFAGTMRSRCPTFVVAITAS